MLRTLALLALASPSHTGANLAVSGVSLSQSGSGVRVTATVRNVGTRRTPRSRVDYRLVRAGRRTPVLVTRAVPALAPGRAARRTVRLTVADRGARVLACVG